MKVFRSLLLALAVLVASVLRTSAFQLPKPSKVVDTALVRGLQKQQRNREEM